MTLGPLQAWQQEVSSQQRFSVALVGVEQVVVTADPAKGYIQEEAAAAETRYLLAVEFYGPTGAYRHEKVFPDAAALMAVLTQLQALFPERVTADPL